MTRSRIPVAVLLAFSLFGSESCSRKRSPHPNYAAYRALSERITGRLEEPFNPVPGTAFVGVPPQWSKAAGGSRNYGEHHQEFRSLAFVLDLTGLDLGALRSRMRQMGAPELSKAEGPRTWRDVVEKSRQDSGIVHELCRAIALDYADRLSGLGLEKKDDALWANGSDGCSYLVELVDAQRSNVVTFSACVLVAPATAQIQVNYFARWGDRESVPPGPAPAWGSRAEK